MTRHFYVWCPEHGETEDNAEALTVNGGPREAACEWAEHDDSNSAEYSILKRGGTLVMVRDKDNRELSDWIVEGESVPHYFARPAKDQR
jgi:hypothetical protein